MNTIDRELRAALRELSEEGRPVNLGRAALAGAKRRRRTHLSVAVVAVAAVAAIAVPVALTEPLSGPAGTSAAPGPAGGGGPAVVTSYLADEVSLEQMVLDPSTGRYRPAQEVLGSSIGEAPRGVAVSPDLQQVAATQNAFRLRIAPTVAGGEPQVVRLPGYGTDPVWSPDSRRLALAGSPPGRDWRYLDTIVTVEADTGVTTTVALDLPRGYAGYRTPGTEVAWLDPDHLVVATVSQTHRYPTLSQPSGERVPLFTGLSVFDLDGALVREVPIDQRDLTDRRDPHAGLMWVPYGEVRDGQVLLTRQERPGTLQLAVLDLSTGDLATDPVSATPPGLQLPDGLGLDDRTTPTGGSQIYHPSLMGYEQVEVTPDGLLLRTPSPAAWLPDGTVLVDTGLWYWENRFTAPRERYLVDLLTGELEPVDMAALESPRFGAAAGLQPQARERAITIR